MHYDSYRKPSKNKTHNEDVSSESDKEIDEIIDNIDNENTQSDIPFHDRIHTWNDHEIYRLPNLIKLTKVNPGEAPFLKRKKIRNAIRFRKIKDNNKFSEICLKCISHLAVLTIHS